MLKKNFCGGAVALLMCGVLHAATYVTFIDRSGSMDHEKAHSAKEGLKLFAATLEDHDQLIVVGFSDQAQASRTFSLRTAEERNAVYKYVDDLVVGGGTNYLSALGLQSWPADAMCLFVSDGEHNGEPQPVIDFVKKEFAGKMALHTVSVQCVPGSAAEQLLTRMAAETRGSFCRVETSEELVRRFVDLAIRGGRYRGHLPKETTVRLDRAVGRVLMFAYDADCRTTLRPHTVNSGYSHVADLPGEDVHLDVRHLPSPTDLMIQLANARSKHSRIGEIYRNDLPSHQFSLDGVQGTVPAGSQVCPKFRFRAGDAAVDPRARGDVKAYVEALDGNGKVIQRVEARPVRDEAALEAPIQVPEHLDAVTFRGTSEWISHGRAFAQSDEVTIAIEKSYALIVQPQQLQGRRRVGLFHETVTVAVQGSVEPVASLAACLKQPVAGLRLVATHMKGRELQLQFEAQNPARSRGFVVLTANAFVPTLPFEIPFDFEVKPPAQGLDLPDSRAADFGTICAGSGTRRLYLRFPTADENAIQYKLQHVDLASGSRVIELQLDKTDIAPTKSTAAVVVASVTVGDVPAGQYLAKITATTADLPDKSWVTTLHLTVTEPLTATAVNLGRVEVGSVVKTTLHLQNLSPARLQNIGLSAPNTFSAVDGASTKRIAATLSAAMITVPPQAKLPVDVEVAVSPLMEERGLYEGQVLVERQGATALRVPIRLTVVDEGAVPDFAVAPAELQLNANPGDVLDFSLSVRATPKLTATLKLEPSVGVFRDAASKPVKIVAAFGSNDKQTLRPGTNIEFKGFVVSPQAAGIYRAELKVSGDAGRHVTVPVRLHVQ